MNLHVGQPQHTGALRFFHGTISARGEAIQDCYFEHPIRWWFGISFARMFIGIIRTEPTRDTRSVSNGESSNGNG